MPASLLHPLDHARRQTTHRRGANGTSVAVSRPAGTDAANRSLGNITLPFLCAAGAMALLSNPVTTTDDGASTLPFVALLGIALASVRWRPDLDTRTSRAVTRQSALALATIGMGIIAAISQGALAPAVAVGPVITVALTSAYLLVWGYRSLALLRTVSLLSLATWGAVADFVHDAVRSSLEQPSQLLYQRLSEIPVFGVDDEPWRIFSAQLHRGALLVLATVVLSLGANRWRMSGRTVVDLLATVSGALIVHHAVILATPIDTYAPTDSTRLATNPTLEIAIAAIAVASLSVVRWRRGEAGRLIVPPSAEADHRDPFIFQAPTGDDVSVALCLVAALAPLALVMALS